LPILGVYCIFNKQNNKIFLGNETTNMKKFSTTLFLTLFFISLTNQAHAYLDPGTGSMILQIVIASLVGAVFALKGYWSRIKEFFSNLLSKKKQ